jgi:hypothetical protein
MEPPGLTAAMGVGRTAHRFDSGFADSRPISAGFTHALDGKRTSRQESAAGFQCRAGRVRSIRRYPISTTSTSTSIFRSVVPL